MMILDSRFLSKWLVAFLLLVCMDMVWLRLSFNTVYKPQFMAIQKRLFFRIWSAIFVWMLLGFSIAFLSSIIVNVPSCQHAYIGMLLGLVIYGTYNFTNYSTLVGYKLNVAILDTLWGCFVIGMAFWLTTLFFKNPKNT